MGTDKLTPSNGVGDAEQQGSTIDPPPEGQKVYSVAHRPPVHQSDREKMVSNGITVLYEGVNT
jgi:hypothetical protein